MHIQLLQLWLNPGDFKQTLSSHELYPTVFNAGDMYESTFTKLSIENVLPT